MRKLPKMLKIAEKLDRAKLHENQIKILREVMLDESSVWHGFTKRMFDEIDRKVLTKFI
jgi:hypothetical protein